MVDKFLGVPYPLQKSARGYFYSQGGVDQIKSDMLILLLTNPSERCMLPQFGTPLRDLIFEPNDTSLHATARQMILNSISLWEPRISVSQVQVLSNVDTNVLSPDDDRTSVNNIMMIRILFFDPNNIQTVQSLTLEVPLGAAQ